MLLASAQGPVFTLRRQSCSAATTFLLHACSAASGDKIRADWHPSFASLQTGVLRTCRWPALPHRLCESSRRSSSIDSPGPEDHRPNRSCRSTRTAARPHQAQQQMSSVIAASIDCSWRACPLPLARAFMDASIHDSHWPNRHACLLWTFTHSEQPGRPSHAARWLRARAFVFRTLARTGSVGG